MRRVGQSGTGKRRGSRRAARPPRRFRKDLFALALAVTVALIGWGYLVHAAIDFGSDARRGNGTAWLFLSLAAVGAAACLFMALILGARAIRALIGAPVSPGYAASDRPTGAHQQDR